MTGGGWGSPGTAKWRSSSTGALTKGTLDGSLAAAFFGAWFCCKTFMGPKAFRERVYVLAIRRATGIGALFGHPDTERHAKAHALVTCW